MPSTPFTPPSPHFLPVPLDKAYRLLNHGGQHNVMAASWACALDFAPPKVTVVLDKATRTRELVQASGEFVLQLPTLPQAAMTVAIGTDSAKTHPDKLQQHGVELFHAPGHATPLVAGCAAWLLCRVIPEPHNEDTYDLFIGEVVAAWADDRIGGTRFSTLLDAFTTFVAGGRFYVTGASVTG